MMDVRISHRPTFLPGSIGTSAQYRQHAADCLRLAQRKSSLEAEHAYSAAEAWRSLDNRAETRHTREAAFVDRTGRHTSNPAACSYPVVPKKNPPRLPGRGDNLPDSKLPCVSGFPWVWLSFISAMKSARGMGLRSVREILEIIGLILPLTVFVLTAIVRRERLRRKACVARTWTADRKVPSGAPPSRPCSIKRKPRRMEPPGLRQPVWGIGAGDNRLTAV